MKVLTLHQPYATLIALGVKTIETRPQPMRTLVGQRIAIHAAKRDPHEGPVGDWSVAEDVFDGWQLRGPGGPGVAYRFAFLPFGAIVATALVTDSLPMRNVHGGTRDNFIWLSGKDIHVERGGLCSSSKLVTDQLPYGDFRPGRYGLLLADVEPLAEPIPFKGGQGLSRSWEPTS